MQRLSLHMVKYVSSLMSVRASGVVSPKFGGSKIFDFRRVTVFCLGHRFSKHKMNGHAKTLGGPWLHGPPGYVCGTYSTCLPSVGKTTNIHKTDKGNYFWFLMSRGASLLSG